MTAFLSWPDTAVWPRSGYTRNQLQLLSSMQVYPALALDFLVDMHDIFLHKPDRRCTVQWYMTCTKIGPARETGQGRLVRIHASAVHDTRDTSKIYAHDLERYTCSCSIANVKRTQPLDFVGCTEMRTSSDIDGGGGSFLRHLRWGFATTPYSFSQLNCGARERFVLFDSHSHKKMVGHC